MITELEFEVASSSRCVCVGERRPVKGQTMQMLTDGAHRGFYCLACLPEGLYDLVDVEARAAVLKATVAAGDTVSWSGVDLTVVDVSDIGVLADDQTWYTWDTLDSGQ